MPGSASPQAASRQARRNTIERGVVLFMIIDTLSLDMDL
jgi:hypothetical protein